VNSPTFFSLFGGLALLLYGLQMAREGLEAMAGARLRTILASVTQNRFLGLLTGATITAAIQSSSAATVMLVGFTTSGLLNLSQNMAVLLGAGIGTTLTVQLIAFDILDWALAIVTVGFLVWFSTRNRHVKALGLSILGFGLVFLSLKLITEGMAPLESNDIVRQILLGVGNAPLWGLFAAAVMTALLHSSAATIGIALAFASQGLMPLSSALPIVLGANIGTCATALVASIGTTPEAKRVALAHVLFKSAGVLLVLPFLSGLEPAVAATAVSVPRQIANAHTLFNLGVAAAFIGFTVPIARLLTVLIPERPEREQPGRPKYLDPRVLDTPSLALAQATRESLRMSDIVLSMYKDTIRVFLDDAVEVAEDIQKRDNWVDQLNRKIKLYITRLSTTSLTEDQSEREVALLALTGDLETIGDIVDRNLMELAKKKIYKGLRFSDRGAQEIQDFHTRVGNNFELVISAFASQDPGLADRVVAEKAAITQMERDLRAAHIERLREGLPESIETSAIHLDVLTNLVRINHHITSIAYPIAEPKSREE
jgi:phosphate:Na+ symporter